MPATAYPAGSGPSSAAVGNFNSDGKPDLAVADEGSGVSILLGNGNGGFQRPMSYAAGYSPGTVAVGDFNGDGKPDLAVGGGGTFGVSILSGDGHVAVGDFNADGKPDLAVANPGNTNRVTILANTTP